MKQDNGNHAATPGPWLIRPENPETVEIPGNGGRVFAAYGGTEANAQLIATAPELLKALEILLSETVTALTKHFAQPRHDMIEDVPSVARARAAIAKAKGD